MVSREYTHTVLMHVFFYLNQCNQFVLLCISLLEAIVYFLQRRAMCARRANHDERALACLQRLHLQLAFQVSLHVDVEHSCLMKLKLQLLDFCTCRLRVGLTGQHHCLQASEATLQVPQALGVERSGLKAQV